MSRNIPEAILEDLYDLNSSSTELILARVDDGATILYFVRDLVDLTFNSQVYTAMPFEITLPNDKEDISGGAHLSIADPNGQLFTVIRTVDTLKAEFEIVHRSAAGVVTSISSFPHFKLSSASWNTATVSFTMVRDDATTYSFPKDTMDNTTFPGLY